MSPARRRYVRWSLIAGLLLVVCTAVAAHTTVATGLWEEEPTNLPLTYYPEHTTTRTTTTTPGGAP